MLSPTSFTFSNFLSFCSGAVNKSVPDVAAHANKEPSQEGNISPPVRKLTALKQNYRSSYFCIYSKKKKPPHIMVLEFVLHV